MRSPGQPFQPSDEPSDELEPRFHKGEDYKEGETDTFHIMLVDITKDRERVTDIFPVKQFVGGIDMDYGGNFVLFLQRDELSISRIDLKTFTCEKLFTFSKDVQGNPVEDPCRLTYPGSRWMIHGLTIDPIYKSVFALPKSVPTAFRHARGAGLTGHSRSSIMLAQACAYNAHRLVRRKHELGLDPLPTSPASRARRRARARWRALAQDVQYSKMEIAAPKHFWARI